MNNERLKSPTPYDDVFRTLLTDCRTLIIPVVNELFHEHYLGNEGVELLQNERFVRGKAGEEDKIISDSYFAIRSDVRRHYHIECQSNPDGSMLIRMFEYESQIAIDEYSLTENALTVNFPESGLLYLRHTEKTPDIMNVIVNVPGEQSVSYSVPVLKVKKYSLNELFEKNLYFLLPFYLFTFESKLERIENDPNQMNSFKGELRKIQYKLEDANRKNEISEYQKQTLIDMTIKVGKAIADRYTNVQKGVEQIMGGQVLQYEAKRILNEGIEQGIEQERNRQEKEREQDTQLYLLMRRDGKLDDYTKIVTGDRRMRDEYIEKYGL